MNHTEDTSSIEKATAYIIQRTARLLRFRLSKFLEAYAISPEQWYILFKLHERPGRSQSELADPNLNDHPNITRMVDALQRNGLLNRTPDPADRRRHQLYLTAAGRELMTAILPLVVEERQKIFQGVSEAEVGQLVSILQRIEQNLV
ncbi:MAG: MarR family transcriptional regulator [Ardenticatenaceae bacterium]|nr:MarR family transcriptional regulator [Ardenticatenaceae bacterium]